MQSNIPCMCVMFVCLLRVLRQFGSNEIRNRYYTRTVKQIICDSPRYGNAPRARIFNHPQSPCLRSIFTVVRISHFRAKNQHYTYVYLYTGGNSRAPPRPRPHIKCTYLPAAKPTFVRCFQASILYTSMRNSHTCHPRPSPPPRITTRSLSPLLTPSCALVYK